MSSRRTHPTETSPTTRVVVIVAFDGVQSLDVAGPYEVFVGANALVAEDDPDSPAPYDVRVVSIDGPASVCTESGLRLGTDAWPDDGRIDTLLIPGGRGVHTACRNEALIAAIREVSPRRLATVCTGTFVAAEAGLLDGRTVTTHWARAQRLATEYPSVHVDPDPIYRRDGNVWTSAGVTAGIDLSLALVDDDRISLRNGTTDVAQTVARWLVMFRHRPGGQSQFAVPVWAPRARTAAVRAVQERIESDPSGDHRLEVLAGVAHMSARHLTRVFTDEVGETPARYVELVRIDAARVALENTDDTLDVVATQCGFGSAETLRRTFHRHLAVAPDQYRRRFHTRGPSGAPIPTRTTHQETSA